jgi:GPH family glycoside/pentoside/hexuronide:cation symporter
MTDPSTPADVKPVSSRNRQTLPRDKVSFKERLSFSLGLVGFSFGYSGINALAYPIYNITLGVSPTLIGLVLAISRLWDAVTDPVMGAISDNSRLRWGRRKPFILVGSILSGIVFPLMWFVPASIDAHSAFWWFLIGALLFFTCFTMFSVPYLSLSYELTPDAKERTRVSAFSSLVGKLTTMSLPWVYRLAQSDFFESTMQGMRVLSVLIGVAFIAFSVPMLVNCKERFQHTASKQQKIGVIAGLRQAMRNRAFMALVLIAMLMQGGTSMIGSLGIYVNSYYIYDGDTKAGAMLTAISGVVYSVTSMLAIPVVTMLANRWGKRNMMVACLICCVASSISKFFFYTPDAPYLQMISVVLMAPGQTAFFVLLGPMKADTADYGEYTTGMRSEGTYTAVSNWIEKVGLTVALFMSGFILDLSGFKIALGHDQTPETFLIIRSLFAFVPAVALGTGLFLLRYYPLTDDRMYAIRDEMEARRGTV